MQPVNGTYQATRGRLKLRKALRPVLRPLAEALCKSWRGEPERHSEAAKKGRQGKRGFDLRPVPTQPKADEVFRELYMRRGKRGRQRKNPTEMHKALHRAGIEQPPWANQQPVLPARLRRFTGGAVAPRVGQSYYTGKRRAPQGRATFREVPPEHINGRLSKSIVAALRAVRRFAQARACAAAGRVLRAYDRLNEAAARHRFSGLIRNP